MQPIQDASHVSVVPTTFGSSLIAKAAEILSVLTDNRLQSTTPDFLPGFTSVCGHGHKPAEV